VRRTRWAVAALVACLATTLVALPASAKVNIPRKVGTSPGWVATPRAPVLTPAPPTNCGTITGLEADISYDFGETSGTVAHDTLHPTDPAYDLIEPPGYGGASLNGGTVSFSGDQLLEQKKPAPWSPQYGDFFVCVVWQFLRDSSGHLLDPDGYNLWQFGRTSTTTPFIKGMPSYTAVRGTGALLNPRLEVVGSGAAGWHTTLVTRVDNLWKMYLDNVLQDSNGQAIGDIILYDSPLSIGGKYVLPGNTDVGTEDMCVCKYALVRAGVTATRGPH
jgi:hypothetical protein